MHSAEHIEPPLDAPSGLRPSWAPASYYTRCALIRDRQPMHGMTLHVQLRQKQRVSESKSSDSTRERFQKFSIISVK